MTSLAEVLDAIAEIERLDGYEGPKIARRLHLIRISCLNFVAARSPHPLGWGGGRT